MQKIILGVNVQKILSKISNQTAARIFSIIPALFLFVYYLLSIKNLYFRSDDFAHLNINKSMGFLESFTFASQYRANANLYRPTTNIFFHLNEKIFGYNEVAFSVEMLLLAVIIFVLSYKIFNHYLKNSSLSILIATIFVFSPIMIEPVTWYANICDTFALLFSLSSIYLYIIYKNRNWMLIASSGLLFFALISKEVALSILPFLFFIIIFEKDYIKNKIIKTTFYLFPAIMYFFIRIGYSQYIVKNNLKVNYTGFSDSKVELYFNNLVLLLKRLFYIPDGVKDQKTLITFFLVVALTALAIGIFIKKNKTVYYGAISMVVGSLAINILTPVVFDRYLVFTYFGLLLAGSVFVANLSKNIWYSLLIIIPVLFISSTFFFIRFQEVVNASQITRLYLGRVEENGELNDVPYAIHQVIGEKYSYSYYNLMYSEPGHISIACSFKYKKPCHIRQQGNMVIESKDRIPLLNDISF